MLKISDYVMVAGVKVKEGKLEIMCLHSFSTDHEKEREIFKYVCNAAGLTMIDVTGLIEEKVHSIFYGEN